MKSEYYWKWFFVAFVVAWAIWEVTPPQSRNLVEYFAEQIDRSDAAVGEQADAILAEARKLEEANPGRNYANLFDAVGTNDLQKLFPFINTSDAKDPNRKILNQLQEESTGQIRLGLDLQGGISFMVQLETSVLREDQDREVVVIQAIEVLRSRVDAFGVAEPTLQPVGDDRILIQLPGLSEVDHANARATLTRPAFLEFRMVHENSEQLLLQNAIVPGYEVLYERTEDETEQGRPFLVRKKPEQGLTGAHLDRASVSEDPMTGQLKINFQMTSEGASLFANVTRQNVGRQLAIVLDGVLQSAPNINSPILAGRGEISGQFTFKEAFQLVNVLENPLEAPVSIIEEQTVEPTLGRDSIQSGIKASLIGLILVVAFMAGYYLLAGAVANFALLLNLVILLGVLCSIDATLTLPGIAGVVLTIGMAVDANVLILERIREELSSGKSTKGAVDAGYRRAFGTIFDANVTTLIASIILINLGKGPVQGFGVTLTIGIIASMFTALVVTRLVIRGFLETGWMKTVSMFELGFLHNRQFDFMRLWKQGFAISWALILIGVGYGLTRDARAVLGVDFMGGDSQVFAFQQSVELAELRDTVESVEGAGGAGIQYQRDLGSGTQTLKITSALGTSGAIAAKLQETYPESDFELLTSNTIGGTVGKEIQKSALIAVTLALFGILVYVALRYEFSFAIGAVLAVVHDVLMTLGWFFLTGRELNATMIAAILTVIGFSINDTIVIFDRIREDLRMGVRGSFRDIMNSAINKCLSRTIITSGTTLMAACSLFVFGGSVINDFSFTFLIGVITGTYSSIYIASSIVLWWTKGEKPALTEVAPEVMLDSTSDSPQVT